ncbi:MAG: LVIVD repeat-containing protein [Agriterribacter sp.]
MTIKTAPGVLYACAAALLFLILPGCLKDSVKGTRTVTYTMLTPVYKTRAEVYGAMNSNPSTEVTSAGKIYIKDQFIYLNEVDKGIHIIDNSNPSNPKQVAFLDIPGNRDMAVKNNILYADMYGDLLAIDISDPAKTTVTKEIRGFFQTRMYQNPVNIDNSLVVVDWIRKDTTIVTSSEGDFNPGDCFNCWYAEGLAYSSADGSIKSLAPSVGGVAGSMASMVLMNDYLYALREAHSVGIVNIATASAPSHDTTFFAGFDLETIYPFQNKLFLGSMTGMFMYDLTNPLVPVKLGEFSHGRACDPVITDGSFAYVTLRAGTNCGGALNELNVVDIKDLMNPVLVKTYGLTQPAGLSKDGDLLFICDGATGVRVYDASDVSNLKELKQIKIDDSYDVIANNGIALVVAKDGLYQYDYSNTNDIKLLSAYSIHGN